MCESNHIVMGYKNNTELFHNVWCIYNICDRAKVHNDCNFDYNKPHRHKYVHRLNILHSWQLDFDCGVWLL